MRVRVDMEACIGSGMCTGYAPEVFRLDDRGELVVLAPDVPPEHRTAVEDAVACCPQEAIALDA